MATEATGDEIKFNGRVIPLKSAKLHEAFSKVNEVLEQIEKSKSSPDLNDLYLKAGNLLDETLTIVQKEKQEEQKKSDTSSSLYNTLIQAVNKTKMTISKERNLTQAMLLAEKIDMEILLNAKQDKLIKELKPQNVIRFIEKALKA